LIAPLEAQGISQVFPLRGAVAVFHAVMAGAGLAFGGFGPGGFIPWFPAADGFALFLFFFFGPGSHGL
jgi:hypothetical protein